MCEVQPTVSITSAFLSCLRPLGSELSLRALNQRVLKGERASMSMIHTRGLRDPATMSSFTHTVTSYCCVGAGDEVTDATRESSFTLYQREPDVY